MQFCNLNGKEIAEILKKAKERIIYAAPGIFREAAEAIVHFAGENGLNNINVILDPTPDVFP